MISKAGKNGRKDRSAWQFKQPEARTSDVRSIPHTLVWEYAEAELPHLMFIKHGRLGTHREMFDWCLDQFGKSLFREQWNTRRIFLDGLVTRKQFGPSRDPYRMYLLSNGDWQGWASIERPVVHALHPMPPEHGSYWFFRTESQRIAFKLRWY